MRTAREARPSMKRPYHPLICLMMRLRGVRCCCCWNVVCFTFGRIPLSVETCVTRTGQFIFVCLHGICHHPSRCCEYIRFRITYTLMLSKNFNEKLRSIRFVRPTHRHTMVCISTEYLNFLFWPNLIPFSMPQMLFILMNSPSQQIERDDNHHICVFVLFDSLKIIIISGFFTRSFSLSVGSDERAKQWFEKRHVDQGKKWL
jgi:hypothetical protein